jgi:2-iminobutanoate/2-iminopropanoate deaminase
MSARHYVGPRTPADTAAPPFSQAVRAGETLYLSGHIGFGPDGRLPARAEDEAAAALDAFSATLGAAGMTMDDLVFVQVFCSDVSLFDAWNRAYRGRFSREFPARAFIGSGPLLFGARFEIQGIAVER